MEKRDCEVVHVSSEQMSLYPEEKNEDVPMSRKWREHRLAQSERWACTMVDFRRELGPQLEDLRSKGLFCDVTMVFPQDGRKMHVHRNILASCSHYFRTLFTFNMTTSGHIEVEIPGITYSDMEAIVQFAYTHKANLTASNIESVIVTADRLNVLGLLKVCEDFLLEHMNTDNAIGIYKIAKYLHCRSLESHTWSFLLKNFHFLYTSSNEFLQLTPDELVQILRADDLIIDSEDYACAAVVKWVYFLPDVRSAYLPQLLTSVRLGLVSRATYDALMQKFSSLPTDSESMCILQKGYELCRGADDTILRPQLCQSLGNPMLRPRVPNEVIFVLGGWSRDGVCADMETYDNRVDKWYENESESYEHSLAYHAMVAVDKALYVIGGYTTVKYLNSAKRFEPLTKTWSEIAPMHSSRCYVCAAELGGLIYACGGFDGTNRHSSVERYCPVKNQWQLVCDMSSVRSDAGACGVDGKLYVAGGFSGTECLNTAECYDPSSNQWTNLTPMSCQRSGVTVVAFQHAIYAIGGFNGSVRLDEVEKYYPDRGGWFPVKEMLKGRSNFAAAVIENKIYVVGGYDGSGTTGHVEFYESDKDEWTEADSLRVGRSAASACTIKGLDNIQEYTFYGKEATLVAQTDSFDWQISPYICAPLQARSWSMNTRSRNKRPS
ncbi:kelch-like protein 10 isoform X1 [Physella acuta]|uniref:kelch-like protein 10 isoform X1 n=2 Tax=Physella acuta TaxID=109671 RepID=UPI0027DB6466|nr:kelch-like protein 10 isoform X1 [Physella acuta]